MVFFFRPCSRRVRWRKRRIRPGTAKLLIALGCLAVLIGLLLLAPQWVLVLLILALLTAIVLLLRHEH